MSLQQQLLQLLPLPLPHVQVTQSVLCGVEARIQAMGSSQLRLYVLRLALHVQLLQRQGCGGLMMSVYQCVYVGDHGEAQEAVHRQQRWGCTAASTCGFAGAMHAVVIQAVGWQGEVARAIQRVLRDPDQLLVSPLVIGRLQPQVQETRSTTNIKQNKQHFYFLSGD